ncbi:hypothetical protein [Chryseobacterium aureum]|uniref:hypothetical protein n=1 Tax=Chryseobacterium aureum TaxID=2497456 RepID=UPI001E2E5D5A|nr:hypothetical protein [Chryseobacterium aureum]
MAAEITMVDSETKTTVTRITKTAEDSEIPTATVVFRTAREIRTTKTAAVSETPAAIVDSEILKAVQDQSLRVEDSETAQAPKAVALQDSRAAAEALDKTIINNKTNS